MADPADILSPLQVPQQVKADAWDAFHSATDQNDLAKRLESMQIPREAKASLWDMKATASTPQQSAPPPADQPWSDVWKHPTHGLIGQGIQGVVSGTRQMMQPGMPNKYAGASQIIGGAEKALTPVAIGATLGAGLPAAIAAPAAAARIVGGAILGGTAGSYLGGTAGQYGAQLAGGGPEAQQLSGDIGSLVGGVAGGYGGSKLGFPRLTRPTNPIQSFLNVLKPKDYYADESLQSAIPDMLETHQAQEAPGKSLVDPKVSYPGMPTKGAVDLASKTENRLQQAYDALSDPRKRVGITIPGDNIKASILKAAEEAKDAPGGAPDVSARLLTEAELWGGKQVPLVDAEAYLRKLNGDINTFQGRGPQGQRVALQANAGDMGVLNAKAAALRDNIYEAVSPLDEGEGARDVKRRWGNVRDARTMFEGMVPKARLETPQPFFRQAMDLYKGGQSGIGRFGMLQAITRAASPPATIDQGLWDAFNNYQGPSATPLPVSVNPRAIAAIEAPKDTSGVMPREVSDALAVGHAPPKPQALLPAPAQLQQPTIQRGSIQRGAGPMQSFGPVTPQAFISMDDVAQFAQKNLIPFTEAAQRLQSQGYKIQPPATPQIRMQ